MIIKTLVEDTSNSTDFTNEHGLSLYIETIGHKILFDLGASDLFLENAKKMNVSIEDVDLVIISHGHYDHGGGLKGFLETNYKAKVYINKKAFGNHFTIKPNKNKIDIGIDQSLKWNDRIIFTEDYLYIDKELELFSNIKGREFLSSCNNTLYRKDDEFIVADNFEHEQNLLITDNDKTILVAGCAHNGIVNIIKHISQMKGDFPNYVFGGFHLFNYRAGKSEDPMITSQIGEFLNKTRSKYYTGHCTGLDPFNQLKIVMEDNIQYLSTGSVVDI